MNSLDQPLVSFILTSYNQERFIREAVEGALSQIYYPLEIIISDDCSADRSYEIIQEIVENYSGRHKVLIRKNSRNIGTFAHVVEAVRLCSGKLVVLAAGDDISKEFRVSNIVNVWRGTGAWGIHSRYDMIDANGNILGINMRSEDLFDRRCELRKYFSEQEGMINIIHGATSAYDRRLFDLLPSSCIDRILSEDGVFSVILNAYGKAGVLIENSLVLYRRHSGAITNNFSSSSHPNLSSAREAIDRDTVYASNIYFRARFLIENYCNVQGLPRPLIKRAVVRDLIFYGVRSGNGNFGLPGILRSIRISFEEGRLGLILPALIGKKLTALYIYIKSNLKFYFGSAS